MPLVSCAIAVTAALWSVTFASGCRIFIRLVVGTAALFLPDHEGLAGFQQIEELVGFLRQLQTVSELRLLERHASFLPTFRE